MKHAISLLVAAALTLSAAGPLGKPLTLKTQTTIADLTAKPADFVGKTIQVRGKVSEVCEKAGCWMRLVDAGGTAVRIKVKDGEIVFPKEAIGRMAVAEGKWAKIELTKEQAIEQAQHEAEENGKEVRPRLDQRPADHLADSGQRRRH